MDFVILNKNDEDIEIFNKNFAILENTLDKAFQDKDANAIEEFGKLFVAGEEYWQLDIVYQQKIEELYSGSWLPDFIILDKTNNPVFRNARYMYIEKDYILDQKYFPVLSSSLRKILEEIEQNDDHTLTELFIDNLNSLESRLLIELIAHKEGVNLEKINYLAGNFLTKSSNNDFQFNYTLFEKDFLRNSLVKELFEDESNDRMLSSERYKLLLNNEDLFYSDKLPNLSGYLNMILKRQYSKGKIFIFDKEVFRLNKFEARILIEIITFLIKERGYELYDFYEIASGQLK